MEYKDYYKILEVPKNATEKEIKAAYRRLARKWHPDLNPQNRAEAERRFKEINEAYEVLSDPEKRQKYDSLGANWHQYEQWQRAGGQGPFQWGGFGPSGTQYQYRTVTPEELEDLLSGLGGSGFSDFFNMFFGDMVGASRQTGRRPRRGQDYEYTMDVTLEEAYTGTQRILELRSEDGRTRRVEVKIPPGVETGSRVRMAGLGGEGVAGGGSGDVYLKINVLPNATYERKGRDLYTELPVDLVTLMLGGEVTVTTPGGKRLALKIAPETQNGTTIRLAGQGMPALGNPQERGDLYVRVKAVLPTNLTMRERQLFEELKKSRG